MALVGSAEHRKSGAQATEPLVHITARSSTRKFSARAVRAHLAELRRHPGAELSCHSGSFGSRPGYAHRGAATRGTNSGCPLAMTCSAELSGFIRLSGPPRSLRRAR